MNDQERSRRIELGGRAASHHMSKHELQHLDLELIQEQTSQCLVAVSSVMCSNKRLLIHVTRYKVQTEPTEIKARLQKEWDKA